MNAVVSPAVASASAANAAASASAAAALASAAAAPRSPTDKDVEHLFKDSESEDEVTTLKNYNAKIQAKRAREKAAVAKQKAVAAELAKKKAVQKAELAKKKAEIAKQKEKRKAARKARLDKKKADAVSKNKEDCLFKVNMAVCGFWPNESEKGGEWYEGTVQAIDYENRTVHVLYQDGDIDDAVPWHLARILSDDVEPGWHGFYDYMFLVFKVGVQY